MVLAFYPLKPPLTYQKFSHNIINNIGKKAQRFNFISVKGLCPSVNGEKGAKPRKCAK
jgi:hypothetical protein